MVLNGGSDSCWMMGVWVEENQEMSSFIFPAIFSFEKDEVGWKID